VEYLKEVSDKTQVKQFVSIFTTTPHVDDLDAYFKRLVEIFEDDDSCRFFFTGMQLNSYKSENMPSQIELAANIEHLKSFFTV